MQKPVGILHVKVVRATKLKNKDLMGKSDPYVKLKLTDDKLPSKKTHVKHNNLNPEWNEEFKIVVKDPESQALEINVFDWEKVGIYLHPHNNNCCYSQNLTYNFLLTTTANIQLPWYSL